MNLNRLLELNLSDTKPSKKENNKLEYIKFLEKNKDLETFYEKIKRIKKFKNSWYIFELLVKHLINPYNRDELDWVKNIKSLDISLQFDKKISPKKLCNYIREKNNIEISLGIKKNPTS